MVDQRKQIDDLHRGQQELWEMPMEQREEGMGKVLSNLSQRSRSMRVSHSPQHLSVLGNLPHLSFPAALLGLNTL